MGDRVPIIYRIDEQDKRCDRSTEANCRSPSPVRGRSVLSSLSPKAKLQNCVINYYELLMTGYVLPCKLTKNYIYDINSIAAV